MIGYDGTNLVKIAYFGAVGVVLSIVSILAAIVILGWFLGVLESEPLYGVSTEEIDTFNTQQQKKLDDVRWVEKDRGIAAVPIGVAMELVVDEVSKDPAAIGAPDSEPPPPEEPPDTRTPAEGTAPEGGES